MGAETKVPYEQKTRVEIDRKLGIIRVFDARTGELMYDLRIRPENL